VIAFCGINCSDCPCYQGTVRADLELLQKTADEWSGPDKKYGANDMICLGCTRENTDFLFSWCKGCGIRNSALEKGVANCVTCDGYDDCEKIRSFLDHHAKPKALMGLLREKYKARG
jgi:hypothetical protein